MVSAARQHEPSDAHDVCSDPLAIVSKLFLQAGLDQRKEGEKSTFLATSRQCLERFGSAAAEALLTSGSLPIATRRGQSNAFALQHFATWLAK